MIIIFNSDKKVQFGVDNYALVLILKEEESLTYSRFCLNNIEIEKQNDRRQGDQTGF